MSTTRRGLVSGEIRSAGGHLREGRQHLCLTRLTVAQRTCSFADAFPIASACLRKPLRIHVHAGDLQGCDIPTGS